jgi:D-alanyl-D-alanine carboxypeptidase (penicillin-binding protein 5/6)
MPDFAKYVSTRRAFFSAPHHKRYQIYTHDHLLLNYRGAIGVKNGYTVAAKASFVGAADRNGHRLVVAMMHGRPDVWRDGARLLTWGFRSLGAVVPCGELVAPVAVPTDATPAGSDAKTQPLPVTRRAAGSGWEPPKAPLAAVGAVIVLLAALRLRARRRHRRRLRGRSKISLPPI